MLERVKWQNPRPEFQYLQLKFSLNFLGILIQQRNLSGSVGEH